MVTLYSGANFTGDARCLKYYKNSTLFDCAPGYYSILAGFFRGLSLKTFSILKIYFLKLGGIAKSVKKFCYSRFLIYGNNHA